MGEQGRSHNSFCGMLLGGGSVTFAKGCVLVLQYMYQVQPSGKWRWEFFGGLLWAVTKVSKWACHLSWKLIQAIVYRLGTYHRPVFFFKEIPISLTSDNFTWIHCGIKGKQKRSLSPPPHSAAWNWSLFFEIPFWGATFFMKFLILTKAPLVFMIF